jgi:hypothetical protein
LTWVVIVVVVVMIVIVLLRCINHIAIPMFSNVVRGETKKEEEEKEEEEATGAMVMCDVSSIIENENENFQLESCAPLNSATKRSYDAYSGLHNATR